MNGDPTERELEGLHPLIQRQAVYLVLAARSVGVPLRIISGRRSPMVNADAGGAPNSLHLDGLAFDVDVAGYRRDEIPFEFWQAVGTWAEQNLGLYWGGRFEWRGERDVNHFDARRWLTEV